MISWEILVFFPQTTTKYLAIQDVMKNWAQSNRKNRKQYVFAYKRL